MSDNKKYYYLKLTDNYFKKEEVVILEAVDNGFIYSLLYLKMLMSSLKDDGRLMFREKIPYDEKMISTVTNIPLDNVRCGIKVLKELGFIEILDSGAIYLAHFQDFIGSTNTEAIRKADYRKRIKNEKNVLNGTLSQKRPPELELELELEKDIHCGSEQKEKAFTRGIDSDFLKRIHNTWISHPNLVQNKWGTFIANIKNGVKSSILQYVKDQDTLIKAIDNYSEILESKNHYWSKKYTLWDFITRGAYAFLDESEPWEVHKNTFRGNGKSGQLKIKTDQETTMAAKLKALESKGRNQNESR